MDCNDSEDLGKAMVGSNNNKPTDINSPMNGTPTTYKFKDNCGQVQYVFEGLTMEEYLNSLSELLLSWHNIRTRCLQNLIKLDGELETSLLSELDRLRQAFSNRTRQLFIYIMTQQPDNEFLYMFMVYAREELFLFMFGAYNEKSQLRLTESIDFYPSGDLTESISVDIVEITLDQIYIDNFFTVLVSLIISAFTNMIHFDSIGVTIDYLSDYLRMRIS